jgi:hypothetical protein
MFFLVSVMVSCKTCKDDCPDSTNPDCPNYVANPWGNPCEGRTMHHGGFKLLTLMQYGPIIWRPSNDTVYATNDLRLVAEDSTVNCMWIVGADTIRQPSYVFEFTPSQIGGTYPVKLISSWEKDSLCFPNDPGGDTVTRYFTPIEAGCTSGIFGRFRIAWDTAPLDSFDIKISCEYIEIVITYIIRADSLFGPFTANLTSTFYEQHQWSYNHLIFSTGTVQPGLGGYAIGECWINPDRTFEAEYSIIPDESIYGEMDRINVHAKGRKIN